MWRADQITFQWSTSLQTLYVAVYGHLSLVTLLLVTLVLTGLHLLFTFSSAQQNCFLHFIFAMPVFSSSLILWESLHISNWYLLLLFTVAAPNMFHLFQAPYTLLPSSFLHTLHQENNDHNICTPSTGCCSAKYILTGVKTKAQIGGRYLLAYINVKRLISKLYFKKPYESNKKMTIH